MNKYTKATTEPNDNDYYYTARSHYFDLNHYPSFIKYH